MSEILIVEDDPSVLETISLLLELEGHHVRTALNGAEGLALLRQKFPDVTITDIEMPILDGPGMALRMFLENHGLEKVPIVIVSAFPNIQKTADEVGTPYFISKPFEIDELLSTVSRAIHERISPARPPQSYDMAG
jgi:DNA-binding NtrC family response regulator